MRKKLALIFLAAISTITWARSGDLVMPVTSRKLAEVKRACTKHLKTRPVCGCVTKNISLRLDRGQFGVDQLDDVVLVMKNLYVMGEIFQPRLESVADYLVGLEFHCQK